jgi:hypothetical protein
MSSLILKNLKKKINLLSELKASAGCLIRLQTSLNSKAHKSLIFLVHFTCLKINEYLLVLSLALIKRYQLYGNLNSSAEKRSTA